MYVEQKLTTREVCRRVLAVQYRWAAERVPSPGRDAVLVRLFACPACRHANPLFTLLRAFDFEVNTVPGPAPTGSVFPNSARRFSCAAHERERISAECARPSPVISWIAVPFTQLMWPYLLWLLVR